MLSGELAIGEWPASPPGEQVASTEPDTGTATTGDAASPAFDPSTFDGTLHVFGMDGDDPLRLSGNAAIGQAGVLRLSGGADHAEFEDPDFLDATSQVSMAFVFRDLVPDGAQTRLLWRHTDFGFQASGDSLSLNLGTEGGSKWLKIGDFDLEDGEWHRIGMSLDAEADILKVYVDGQLALERDDLDLVAPDSGRDFWIGGTPWGRGLEGEIDSVLVADGILGPEGLDPTAWESF